MIFLYKTPLVIAIENGNLEMVQFLFTRKDIDVNKQSILNL